MNEILLKRIKKVERLVMILSLLLLIHVSMPSLLSLDRYKFEPEGEKEEFTLSFDKKDNEIDADTLARYLQHFNAVIYEINRSVEPDKRIVVTITTFTDGSFRVPFQLQAFIDKSKIIFSSNNVTYVASMMTIYGSIIDMKSSANDSKTMIKSSISSPSVYEAVDNSKNTINYVSYKIYTNNVTVNTLIEKQFQALRDDESIEGIRILDKNENEVMNVRRESFEFLAAKEKKKEDTDFEFKENAILNIIKPSFDPTLVSTFYYQGRKISAKIHDKLFYELVENGKQFAAGDRLKVRLKINRHFDIEADTFVIDGYEVTDVTEHIPRDRNNEIGFAE